MTSDNSSLKKFLEPTFVVTALTGFAYLMGRIHLTAYYNTFGIDPASLGLDLTDFLYASLSSIGIGLIYTYQAYSEPKSSENPRRSALSSYSIFVPFIAIMLIVSDNSVATMIAAAAYFIATALLTIRKIHFATLVSSSNASTRILVIAAISALTATFTYTLGQNDARNLLAASKQSTRVKFTLNDPGKVTIPNLEYILIAHRNNTYYFAPKIENRADPITLYALPDREVQLMTMTTAKN